MSKRLDTLSGLRRRYRDLVEAREVLEKRLVRRREYFQGSLSTIAHPNKTGPSTPYYYISCRKNEGRGVVYVRRRNLARARKLVRNWQEFKKDLKRLRTLNQDVARILEQIVDVQTVMNVNDD
jgi:hypothetical protein